MIEEILRDFEAAHGMRSVCLRYFNAAGADPDGEVGEAHMPKTHLIPLVLEAAGLDRACVLLITTPSPVVTLSIARYARQLRPELHIVARAETEELLEELHELGVHEVVLPQMEAGLEMTRQALLHLKVPDQQIERFSDEVRSEFYRPLLAGAGDSQSAK